MTDLLARPAPPAATKPAKRGQPLAGYGLVVAGWTAFLGLTICIAVAVVGWFAADSGTFGDALRVGALSWLVGNGGGLHLRGVEITVLPLGALGLIAWTLYRGGRWAGNHSADRSWRDIAAGTGAIGIGYCAVAVAVFAVTRSADVHAHLVRTAGSTLLLGLIFGGLGILRGAGRGSALLDRLPVAARAALRGGLGGAAVLAMGGAVLATIAVVAHFSTAVILAESLHSGLVGGAVVALLGLALMPNAVLCAGAFLAGPGFALGSGTVVAPGDIATGPLPAFPLLAAVPRTGGATWWEFAVLTVPLAAGGIAGLLAIRRYPVSGFYSAAVRGGLAGLVAGAGFGLLTGLGGGAIGPGRMQDVGPYLLPTVVACASACLLGGAVTAVATRWLSGRPLPGRHHTDPASTGQPPLTEPAETPASPHSR